MAADPRRVKELFVAALDLPDPQARQVFLERECGADADLRQRLEILLKAHDEPASALERPLTAAAPATTCYHGSAEDVGAVIAGRYKLLEQIGEGGMGTVWVAEQTQPVRRKVALKLIKAGMDSKAVLARFEAERQALALMDHPHIAKVLDGGTTESGRPFFVMKYVKGVPLTRYCDDARLGIAERLALFVPVCQAVQHAHQKGIIHRDLKPSNILVCLYDGKPVPKVIDFGLAKAMHQPLTEHTLHTAHGAMMGTPLYMSPEQAEFNNLDVDTRTDIYALGVILYELLTGTTPLEKQRFQEAAWQEMLRLIKEEEPPRPSARLSGSGSLPSLAAQRQVEPVKLTRLVRGELDWIVMKCLEKDRSRRYETAAGLARDVERYLADEVVEARPPSASYRLRKLVRRNRGRVVAAGLLAAMLLLMVGLVAYGAWWAERQSAERRHEQALVAAHDRDALSATLDRVEAALRSGRVAEAGTLLGQADRQAEEPMPPDLRERHGRLRQDERAVRQLDDIFEERWMVSRSDTRLDSQRARRRYPAVFKDYDLAVGSEPAAHVVEKVRRSVIADALSSGLTEWFFVDPNYPGLLAVVDALDPDPGRAALRAAIIQDEDVRVREIGKTIDGSRLAPAYAVGLATHPAVEDGERILKAAWAAHPDSFPLALTICSRFCGRGDQFKAEAVGWARIAVALRPNNPLAHYYHAIALSQWGGDDAADVAGALDELRRTIELASRFARAYGQRAFLLQERSKGEEDVAAALAAARTAVELDPQNLLGHFVLYRHLLLEEKDYPKAAEEFRAAGEFRGYYQVGTPRSQGQLEEAQGAEGYALGWGHTSLTMLVNGLHGAGRPFEAYRLILGGDGPRQIIDFLPGPSASGNYQAARVAALAGTGRGADAPPPAERAAVRGHALEWLNTDLYHWKHEAAALPALAANTVGLMGHPSQGHCFFLPAIILEVATCSPFL
jgi:hypothetical protein